MPYRVGDFSRQFEPFAAALFPWWFPDAAGRLNAIVDDSTLLPMMLPATFSREFLP